MSIMDELKKLTRPYDDDDTLIDDGSDLDVDVDVEPSYTRPVTPVQPAQEPVINPMGAAPVNTGMGGYSVNEIPTPITMGGVADSSKYRVVLVKPEEFDAATAIAKHICQGDTVILNCEETNDQVARRAFYTGDQYALDFMSAPSRRPPATSSSLPPEMWAWTTPKTEISWANKHK